MPAIHPRPHLDTWQNHGSGINDQSHDSVSVEQRSSGKRARLGSVSSTSPKSDRPEPTLLTSTGAPVVATIAAETAPLAPDTSPDAGPDVDAIIAALRAHRDTSKAYCDIPHAVTRLICNQACVDRNTLARHHESVHIKVSIVDGVMRMYTSTRRLLRPCTISVRDLHRWHCRNSNTIASQSPLQRPSHSPATQPHHGPLRLHYLHPQHNLQPLPISPAMVYGRLDDELHRYPRGSSFFYCSRAEDWEL
jgi:hypothetical protein